MKYIKRNANMIRNMGSNSRDGLNSKYENTFAKRLTAFLVNIGNILRYFFYAPMHALWLVLAFSIAIIFTLTLILIDCLRYIYFKYVKYLNRKKDRPFKINATLTARMWFEVAHISGTTLYVK